MSFCFREQVLKELQCISEDYALEKIHSHELDLELGYRISSVEEAVVAAGPDRYPARQLWQHLSSDAFQTPYSELLRILRSLAPAPGSRVVDLGAGYGRLAFIVESFFEGVEFTGYELAPERVQEARRVFEKWGLDRSVMIETDLQAPNFRPIHADFYFLYDFGTRPGIEKVLENLQQIARVRSICVTARGRASRDAIERGHPWLSQVHPPRHFAHYSIYSS